MYAKTDGSDMALYRTTRQYSTASRSKYPATRGRHTYTYRGTRCMGRDREARSLSSRTPLEGGLQPASARPTAGKRAEGGSRSCWDRYEVCTRRHPAALEHGIRECWQKNCRSQCRSKSVSKRRRGCRRRRDHGIARGNMTQRIGYASGGNHDEAPVGDGTCLFTDVHGGT
jgi:hypothetical protein